ncbi:MAG: hypothetical protein E7588_03485 [Ruminococcaceae bacterium]|nr:hypothetical protein [Oscillospiraceae bacterium]
MNDLTNNSQIPLGLGMAFAQNMPAMEYFAGLTAEQKQNVIDRAHSVNSKKEMKALVQQLANHEIEF